MKRAEQQRSSWDPRWDKVEEPASVDEALKLIRECWQRNAWMMRVLAQRRLDKGLRAAKRLQRRYLRSDSARIAAAASAVCRGGALLDGSDEDAVRSVFQMLPDVCPWSQPLDRLIAVPHEKLSGGDRYVYRGIVLRCAINSLVKAGAQVLVNPEPTQFMSVGGRPAMEAWLREHLPSTQLVITTDIPNEFESALRGPLETGLPLPRRVMEMAIFDPKDRAVILRRGFRGLTPYLPEDASPADVLREVVGRVSPPGRGLAQGTAPAALAAEWLMGIVIRAVAQVSPDTKVGSFGDNLIILLADASAAQPVMGALASAVEQTFGHEVLGELTRRTRRNVPTKWFSFCGRDYKRHGKQLHSRITAGRAIQFVLKMQMRIQDAMSSHVASEPAAIERSILGWMA